MNLDGIRDALQATSLERIADEVMRDALPGIRIVPDIVDESELPIGASKMGGHPDLPPGLDWPTWHGTPQAFIAQFHLPDLVSDDVESVLPPTGMLYFFYEAEEQPWGYDPADRGAWSVLYFDGDIGTLHRLPAPETLPEYSRLAPHSMSYSVVMTLRNDDRWISQLELSDKEFNAFLALTSETNALTHQLLGHPEPLQGAMEGACESCSTGRSGAEVFHELGDDSEQMSAWEAAAAEQWRLLLQVDAIPLEGVQVDRVNTWPHQDWALGGLIYFWIRKDALARRDFSNVWLQLQTT
jgi:uncharacterized protein YwqG